MPRDGASSAFVQAVCTCTRRVCTDSVHLWAVCFRRKFSPADGEFRQSFLPRVRFLARLELNLHWCKHQGMYAQCLMNSVSSQVGSRRTKEYLHSGKDRDQRLLFFYLFFVYFVPVKSELIQYSWMLISFSRVGPISSTCMRCAAVLYSEAAYCNRHWCQKWRPVPPNQTVTEERGRGY